MFELTYYFPDISNTLQKEISLIGYFNRKNLVKTLEQVVFLLSIIFSEESMQSLGISRNRLESTKFSLFTFSYFDL